MEIFTPGHLIVIAVVALVLFFGWKQLPDMARSMGRSLRVFKTEIKGMGDDDKARNAKSEDAEGEARETPKAIEAREVKPQAPAAKAEVVRNPAAEAAEPARARPRPAPSPNGRAS